MSSLNTNERVECPECGREYTRSHASRHRKHCGVLKWFSCNFYTYSSEELTNHIRKKHCQPNVKLCAQQSQNTLQDKVNLINFYLKHSRKYFDNNFLLNLKSLYTKFEKLLVKFIQFFHHSSGSVISFFSKVKVLIDDKTSSNRLQIVVEFSMESTRKSLTYSKNSIGCTLAEILLR